MTSLPLRWRLAMTAMNRPTSLACHAVLLLPALRLMIPLVDLVMW